MPQRDVAPIGAPCWIDLATSDPEKSHAFYGELFGWTVMDPGEEYGGYVSFLKDGVAVAGCMRNGGELGPDAWSVYLATDDVEKTAAMVAGHGGQVVMPVMAVLELGSMAFVTDPGHAAIGIWQPGLHQGFGVHGEPGTPAWFELHTRDYEESVRFYCEVFGWDAHAVSDTPELRYTTLGQGDGQLAGIMDAAAFLPEGAAGQWSVYFGTADTDATLAKVVELGGSVVQPAEDTPYGRLAQATDSTGALFKLVAGP